MNKQPTGPERQQIEALIGAKGGAALRYRKLGVTAALVLLAGAGLWYWLQPSGGGEGLRYTTDSATRGDLIIKVTATGAVQPTTKVDLSSELSGTVRKVLVDFNSQVKTGDILAELDKVKLEATLAASRARLSVALAQVQDAEVSLAEKKLAWERKQRLSENNYGSLQDRDTAKAAYDRAAAQLISAHANVDMAKADLELSRTNLERASIRSPINGVILMRKVDPGQTVASSLQAPVLFTIAEDLSRIEIQVDVDEADVGKVKAEMRATFAVDAYPNRRFDAKIRLLRFGSEVVQGVVTYKAILAAENNDRLLRPGMTATAEIIVQTEKDALTIANQALRFTPAVATGNADTRGFLERILPGRPQFRAASRPQQARGAQRRIWVLRDGLPAPVNVRVGPTDGRRTLIAGGDLKEGDAVIVDSATPRRR